MAMWATSGSEEPNMGRGAYNTISLPPPPLLPLEIAETLKGRACSTTLTSSGLAVEGVRRWKPRENPTAVPMGRAGYDLCRCACLFEIAAVHLRETMRRHT